MRPPSWRLRRDATVVTIDAPTVWAAVDLLRQQIPTGNLVLSVRLVTRAGRDLDPAVI